jgi:hypothetical protein
MLASFTFCLSWESVLRSATVLHKYDLNHCSRNVPLICGGRFALSSPTHYHLNQTFSGAGIAIKRPQIADQYYCG